jgi:hypothetical protein
MSLSERKATVPARVGARRSHAGTCEATAALVPDTAIGRLLDQDEAAKLIRRLERGIPQRPDAGIRAARGEAEAGMRKPRLTKGDGGAPRREARERALGASPSGDSTGAAFLRSYTGPNTQTSPQSNSSSVTMS